MGMRIPDMSWRELRDAAVRAEELGYSCITMGESWGEDALTSLAHLAAVTSRIRLGTSTVPVFARSPANLAVAALNVDRMSEGRFFLGLGTSGRLVIEDFHGEAFRKPLTRMREYIGSSRPDRRRMTLPRNAAECTAPGFLDTQQDSVVIVSASPQHRETAISGNTQMAAPLGKSPL